MSVQDGVPFPFRGITQAVVLVVGVRVVNVVGKTARFVWTALGPGRHVVRVHSMLNVFSIVLKRFWDDLYK